MQMWSIGLRTSRRGGGPDTDSHVVFGRCAAGGAVKVDVPGPQLLVFVEMLSIVAMGSVLTLEKVFCGQEY